MGWIRDLLSGGRPKPRSRPEDSIERLECGAIFHFERGIDGTTHVMVGDRPDGNIMRCTDCNYNRFRNFRYVGGLRCEFSCIVCGADKYFECRSESDLKRILDRLAADGYK